MKKIFYSALIIGFIAGCSQEGNNANQVIEKEPVMKLPTSKSIFAFCKRLEGYGKDYRERMAPEIAKLILLEEDGIEDSSKFINKFTYGVSRGNFSETMADAENAMNSFTNNYYQEKSTTGAFESGCTESLLGISFEETPKEQIEKTE